MTDRRPYTPRDVARAGIFGAAALVMPALFHLFLLGRVFMPMYLPLVALAFLVRPVPAIVTAGLIPLLSGVLTGMPPFYPPIAPVMATELALMAGIIAMGARRTNPWLLLAVALIIGRVAQAGLMFALANIFDLPPALVSGFSFFSGWPGLILMMVVVPPFAYAFRDRSADVRLSTHA